MNKKKTINIPEPFPCPVCGHETLSRPFHHPLCREGHRYCYGCGNIFKESSPVWVKVGKDALGATTIKI